ncbi:hypothetical protein BHM03_00032873 [Ensete ventricosum]|nr:hypothetical protein BHM03_00032873 [Ensete ventricosum]
MGQGQNQKKKKKVQEEEGGGGRNLEGCEQEAAIHAPHRDVREVLLTQSNSDHKHLTTHERGRREDHHLEVHYKPKKRVWARKGAQEDALCWASQLTSLRHKQQKDVRLIRVRQSYSSSRLAKEE